MIIVEGVDKVGKTTLCKILSEQLPDHTSVHNDIPKRTAFQEHMECLTKYGNNSIIDRLHWSEYCYGLTYRNDPGYTILEWNSIESLCVDNYAIVIYLVGEDQEALIKRWEFEEKFSKDKLQSLQSHYDELANNSNLQVYKADVYSLITSLGKPTPALYNILEEYAFLQEKINSGMKMSPKLRNVTDSIRILNTGGLSWRMVQGSVETPTLES